MTDENGDFEVREVRPNEAYRIGATAEGFASPLIDFTPGADLLIELFGEAAIEGTVLLDDEISPENVNIRLHGDTANQLDYRARSTKLEENGSFRLGGLLPGEYELLLRLDGHYPELERLTLELEEGRVVRPPTVDPLDLRGRFFAHSVKLSVPETRARLSGSIQFAEAGAEKLGTTHYFHKLEFPIYATSEVIDLEVNVGASSPSGRAK